MSQTLHSNNKKKHLHCKKFNYNLTSRDVNCLIAAITLGIQAITTLMTNELAKNPYSNIAYGIIVLAFVSMICSLSYHKKKYLRKK